MQTSLRSAMYYIISKAVAVKTKCVFLILQLFPYSQFRCQNLRSLLLSLSNFVKLQNKLSLFGRVYSSLDQEWVGPGNKLKVRARFLGDPGDIQREIGPKKYLSKLFLTQQPAKKWPDPSLIAVTVCRCSKQI